MKDKFLQYWDEGEFYIQTSKVKNFPKREKPKLKKFKQKNVKNNNKEFYI